MKPTAVPHPTRARNSASGRVRQAAAFVAAALVLTGAGQIARGEPTSDEKIQFYRARAGGQATYPAYARLGLAYLQKFRESGQARYYDEGLRYLRQSLSYQPNFEALLGLARGLAERHHFKEALSYAEQALGAMPADLEAAGALFDIRLALGQTAEAEAGLKRMAGEPTFQAWSRLAALREYRGDLPGALEAMQQARGAAAGRLPKPTRAWTEVRIGSLQMALCDPAKARQAYARALALVPGYALAQEHLAEWHAALGHWQEAERIYRELLQTGAEPQHRLGLAEACRELGKTSEAKEQVQEALGHWRQSVREGFRDSFQPLTWLLLEREGTCEEGMRWAERDWDVRQDALAADTLAWAHYRNGHPAEALRFSQQALASGSKAPALLLHAGLIRTGLGQKAAGRALLEQALGCRMAFGPYERELAKTASGALAAH